MDSLKDIVTFVTRRGLSEKEIFGNEKSKQRDLFNIVASGKVVSDESAIKKLFSNNSSQNLALYRKTKSRLMERLFGLVPNVEIKDDGYSATTSAKKQCIMDLAIAEILMSGGAVISSRDKYKSVLNKAELFSFTQKALIACEALLQQYSLGKNSSEISYYEKKKEELVACVHAENESDDLSRAVNSILSRYSTPTEIQILEIENAAFRAEELSELFPKSFKLRTKATRLKAFAFMLKLNYAQAIESIESLLNYVSENKHLINRSVITVFYGLMVQCATALNDVKTGLKALEAVRNAETEGTANWRVSILEEILFFFSIGSYDEAAQSFARLTPHITQLKNHQSEKYRIFQGYLSIMYKMGMCSSTENNIPLQLKAVDIFTNWEIINHDKQGLNIHTTIQYFLLMLIEKNHHGLSVRSDTTRAYRLNHLGNQSRSAALFFRFERLSEMDFEYDKIERYAVRRGFVLTDQRPMESNEIIPFDVIWKMCEALIAPVRQSIIIKQKKIGKGPKSR